MNGLRRHPFRITGRFLWFVGVVIVAAFDFLFRCAFRQENSAPAARALWLQRHSRRVLSIFKIEAHVEEPVPARGLLVSNHQGYLDIFLLASMVPAVFVAKREIKFWPVIGWLTQMGGTLFVDRERRIQVGRMNDEIQSALDRGALVVLFPEGASSNGETVLPFKSSLLEQAAQSSHPLSVSAIQYTIKDGDVAGEVCYWGDHTFFPHLLNLLGKHAVRATVRFAPVQRTGADRKQLAVQLREEILKLKRSTFLD
jgi:1-acyl-sn-glycerol-3-phosphate acyltransferase